MYKRWQPLLLSYYKCVYAHLFLQLGNVLLPALARFSRRFAILRQPPLDPLFRVLVVVFSIQAAICYARKTLIPSRVRMNRHHHLAASC